MTTESGKATLFSARTICLLLLLLVVAGAGWLLFSRGMQRDLNHDEHQFLAPGLLLSREGLLPYRDYPLFHLPNLVFVYAALDRVTHAPLAAAKLLSVLTSTLLIALFAHWAWKQQEQPPSVRLAVALTGAVLFLWDPVILFTSGKTWNHEVPTALMVAALCLQATTIARPSMPTLFSCGLLAALSAGSRLTFGPMLIPLFVMGCMTGNSTKHRIRSGLSWSAGALLGFLPSIWLFALSPENFVFGNLEFPRLRLADPTNLRVQKTVRWSAKLRYFFKEVALPSWPVFLAFAAFGVRPGWRWLRTRSGPALSGIILLVLPFALLGCFAPSRYQYQHYFVISALLAVGVVAGIISARLRPTHSLAICAVVMLATGFSASLRKKAKDGYSAVQPPLHEWFAFSEQEQSADLRKVAISGPVLTLAPTWPLQAGLRIYPEFATGPFAWRSANLLSSTRRKAVHMIAPDDLDELLSKTPPGAIYTGVESEDLEAPLVAYAKSHGFTEAKCARRRSIWLPPIPATARVSQ